MTNTRTNTSFPFGPITTRELRRTLSHEEISSAYERLWRGMYRRADQPPTFRLRSQALALHHPQGVLCGRSAAAVWGDDSAPDTAVPEIWLRSSRVRDPDRCYRSGTLPDAAVTTHAGTRVTTVLRTAIDLATTLTHSEAVVALDRLMRARPDLYGRIVAFLEHPAGAALERVPESRRGALRRVFAHTDRRALTLGESVARVALTAAGCTLLVPGYLARVGDRCIRVPVAAPSRLIAVEIDDAGSLSGFAGENHRLRELQQAGWTVIVAAGPRPPEPHLPPPEPATRRRQATAEFDEMATWNGTEAGAAARVLREHFAAVEILSPEPTVTRLLRADLDEWDDLAGLYR